MVFDELNKLKTEKSPGSGGWPLCYIQEILRTTSFQPHCLFCLTSASSLVFCHLNGELPLLLLIIHHLASNYRPVSLTSTVVKVMESIVKTNVLEHLTSNNLLTCHQFGFSRGHSCTTQLLHVMDILTKSLDQDVPVDVIYMDLQKAFDTVPHNCLLYKIEYYGIMRNLLRWIAEFLYSGKVWWIDLFWAFGKRKFGELVDQPIDY